MTGHRDVFPHERIVVTGALSAMVLHNVDEAFLHPEQGGRFNLAMGILVTALVTVLFPRMNRWWRVAVLGFLGLQGTVAGLTGHVIHIVRSEAAPLDYSGVLFTLGGVVLLLIAVAEARTPEPDRAQDGRVVEQGSGTTPTAQEPSP